MISPEIAVNRQFLNGKSNFFCVKLSKNQNFSEICLKNRFFFVKLPEKVEIYGKFAVKNGFFL